VRRLGGASLVAVTAVAAIGLAEVRAEAARPAPARLQVGAEEFRYSLSRLRLRAGPAIVELVNYGEDDHNLRLRRIGGTYTHRVPRTAPGDVSELRTRFRAGRFRLWCSLEGHAGAGMKATLRVVRPS
jgi:plastocyanin